MASRTETLPRYVVFFLTFACLGVGVWFLSAYSVFFNSFFLAIMIVMTASPLGFWLQNHGVPKWLALGLSVLAALSVTILVALVLAIASMQMLNIIPLAIDELVEAEISAGPFLSRFGLTYEDISAALPPDSIARVFTSIIEMTLKSVSFFGMVILIVVFMVIEAFIVPITFKNKKDFGELPAQIALGFTNNIRQYVGITSLLGIIGGGVIAIILYMLGIPFAFLWGILYFVLNFVPMIGFWLALIPPIMLTVIAGDPTAALLVFVAYSFVSTLINQAVKPAVMRGGLDLSPFWSIMSLIIWSTILGPLGLVVGVPLTIALKELVFEPDANSRWIADLLGAGLPVNDQDSSEDSTNVDELAEEISSHD